MNQINKKTLATRLRSIEHYIKEISDLEETLKITRETRDSIVASMVEFFPFNPGDVITNGDRIIKVEGVKRAGLYNKRAYIETIAHIPIENYGHGGWSSSTTEISIYVSDFDNWRVLIPAPIKEQES